MNAHLNFMKQKTNTREGPKSMQDEDEEEEQPALSPHAVPVYMCNIGVSGGVSV